jgi:hypothetical protein
LGPHTSQGRPRACAPDRPSSHPLGPDVIHSFELNDGTEIKVIEPRDRRATALEASANHLIALDVMNLHVFPAGEVQ